MGWNNHNIFRLLLLVSSTLPPPSLQTHFFQLSWEKRKQLHWNFGSIYISSPPLSSTSNDFENLRKKKKHMFIIGEQLTQALVLLLKALHLSDLALYYSISILYGYGTTKAKVVCVIVINAKDDSVSNYSVKSIDR
ncbi:hypothetical protein AAHA92_10668 [Salvia divinorum]|uniref:Uncharacterized protein n=1 Tax=Salvia divinorum TaxID=28513 RepID=A0ABD1HVF9_SALDI